MNYLVLAILSSTLISFAMKLADKRIKNNMVLFLTNYFICSFISLYYLLQTSKSFVSEGLTFALALGAVNGALYLISLIAYKKSIRENGMVLTAIFMKLGVLVPTAMAVFIFKEHINLLQVCGIALAIIASIIINTTGSKKDESVKVSVLLLASLVLLNGFGDSTSNIYDKFGNGQLKDVFLLLTFFVAFLISTALAFKNKEGLNKTDVFYGVLVGVPNYFSARFLLLSLASVPAVIAYPVYNVGSIILVSLIGWLLFKEKMTRNRLIGIALILVALVLING